MAIKFVVQTGAPMVRSRDRLDQVITITSVDVTDAVTFEFAIAIERDSLLEKHVDILGLDAFAAESFWPVVHWMTTSANPNGFASSIWMICPCLSKKCDERLTDEWWWTECRQVSAIERFVFEGFRFSDHARRHACLRSLAMNGSASSKQRSPKCSCSGFRRYRWKGWNRRCPRPSRMESPSATGWRINFVCSNSKKWQHVYTARLRQLSTGIGSR